MWPISPSRSISSRLHASGQKSQLVVNQCEQALLICATAHRICLCLRSSPSAFRRARPCPHRARPASSPGASTGGVTMLTRSTSSRATTSRQSSATCSMSNSRATRSAFSRCPLAIATTRAPSHARKPGICVERAKPAPMMPIPMKSFLFKLTPRLIYVDLNLPCECFGEDKVICPRPDLNREPTDYESAALTIELRGHTEFN